MADKALRRINMQLFDVYRKAHGNLLIPSKFVVPATSQWPEEHHGMRLGDYLKRIRSDIRNKSGVFHSDDSERLLKLGITVDMKEHLSNEILLAFKTYKDTFGNLNINKEFKVPNNDPDWPRSLWNSSLSNVLKTLRNKPGEHLSIRPALIELGLDLTKRVNAESEFNTVLAALTAYKEIHRNLLVKTKYVIPLDDKRYPEETRGMKLGKVLFQIRSETVYADKKTQLKELGVSYDVLEEVAPPKFSVIHAAIKAYIKEHGNVDIPQGFVVPEDHSRYSQSAIGMKLGNIVHSMKTQGTYGEYKAELAVLGIECNDKTREADYQLKYDAFVAFKKIHGHLLVPKSFSIPSGDDKWPQHTWGLKLGSVVKRIRYKGYYSSKRPQLEELGFVYRDTNKTNKVEECD